MLKVYLNNRFILLRGLERKYVRGLDKITSYPVKGAYFAPSYKAGTWDGRIHLLKYSHAEHPGFTLPSGMICDLIKYLSKHRIEHIVKDQRRKPASHVLIPWNPDVKLRPYQQKAVDAIVNTSDYTMGKGILKMPIRSGKTTTAAAIIHALKLRTLFVVPSQLLLYQTQKALENILGRNIGIIGDAAWKPNDVTVATIQSLVAKRKGSAKNGHKYKSVAKERNMYKELIDNIDLLFFDECHHLRGRAWQEIPLECNAMYKIGLSATVNLDNAHENNQGEIWLRAATGDIIVDISTSKLIEDGWLLRPIIELHTIRLPKNIAEYRWSKRLQDEAIYLNPYRNKIIIDEAEKLVKERGLKVLIVTNRKSQIEALREMLENKGLAYEWIIGDHKSGDREQKKNAFVNGEVQVLLGTVLSEGIDIPEIEGVINAQGGRSDKATIQRMRNLTPHHGKTEAIFIDFIDLTNPYFAQHTKDRLDTYKSEPAFIIKMAD